MTTNAEKSQKLEKKIWTKYNRKGQRPPIELVRKLAFLQGKSKEEVMTNKVFINPDPNFTIRPSNRGYIWDMRE